jgi:molybdopterin-containing oxidoreductase family iron-sulfur binding subunit
VVEKCNFCAERLAVGQLPACVEVSKGALTFGDLYNPASAVRELIKTNYTIRRKQTLGTEPSVYYIV